MTTLKNIKFSTIKDIVWAATIIIGVLLWWRDEVKDRIVYEEQIKTVQKNQEEILKTMHEHGTFWIQQKELNGKVIMYIDLDSR